MIRSAPKGTSFIGIGCERRNDSFAKKTTVYAVVFLTEITLQTKRYAGSSDKGFILEAAVFHFASVL